MKRSREKDSWSWRDEDEQEEEKLFSNFNIQYDFILLNNFKD